MTTFINIKDAPEGWRTNPKYTFVGRPSFLGNPYHIGKDGTRNGVIRRYEDYLKVLQADNRELFYNYFETCVRDHILVCFCHPLRCHASVIIEWLEKGLHEYKLS